MTDEIRQKRPSHVTTLLRRNKKMEQTVFWNDSFMCSIHLETPSPVLVLGFAVKFVVVVGIVDEKTQRFLLLLSSSLQRNSTIGGGVRRVYSERHLQCNSGSRHRIHSQQRWQVREGGHRHHSTTSALSVD